VRWSRVRFRRLPLSVAGLMSFPLFLSALMAASLAVERPEIEAQWRNGKGTLISVFDDPSGWEEAKIWLLALAVVALLLACAVVASLLPRGGIVLVGVAGIIIPLALMRPLDEWAAHHTQRFPYGADLIRDSNPSNILLRGEWEESAVTTARELAWVTIGIAAATLAVTGLVALRRARGRGARPPVLPPPPAVTGGPEISPTASFEESATRPT
jgi:hypothetical protein